MTEPIVSPQLATEKPPAPGVTALPAGLAKEIDQMSYFSDLLPFRFGGDVLETLAVDCACCKNEITAENIRGKVEALADGKTAAVTAYAMCYGCHTVTPVEAKFFCDGEAMFKAPDGWKKGSWKARPVPLHIKAQNFVAAKWQQIVPPAIGMAIFLAWIICKA